MALFEGRALLQRGRWINPLVFAHMAAAKRLPKLKRVEKPIYIMGTGRSGTTVLGTILSFHKDVSYLNEPKGMWYAACPFEDVIGSYTDQPAKYRMDAADATPAIRRNIERLYGAYLRVTGGRRVVDKSDWAFRVPFLLELFPDATFLITIRNGWDTCRSVERVSKEWGYTKNGVTYDWWGVNSRKWHYLIDQIVSAMPRFDGQVEDIRALDSDTDRAVVEWIAVMTEALDVAKRYPESVMLVRFEELCQEPERLLGELAEFTALPADPAFMAYGCRELNPVPARKTFDMHPILKPHFDAMMRELGYDI